MAKIAITSVHVFDGHVILPLGTVVIDGGLIVSGPCTKGAEIIDGNGGTLLPGLIDAHVHLHGPENLKQMARWGITTALDMASFNSNLLISLRERVAHGGITDFRSPGIPAVAPGSTHSRIPGFPGHELVSSPETARAFVETRAKEGVSYIKIIADLPGLDQETLNAIVVAAKLHGKKTIAHAAENAAFPRSIEAGVDFITHVPLDIILSPEICQAMKEKGIVSIPTLTMMHGVAKNRSRNYSVARDSVSNLHKAGVVILAGTDANMQPGIPANVVHGESLHEELELLIEAGLTEGEVLRAATSDIAKWFGLGDRGKIGAGRRADMVLLEGSPLEDIRLTRGVKRVWCGGVEVERV